MSLKTTSLISWIGGKCRMSSKILPFIARAERKTYIEPFGGGAGLMQRKPPEEREVYNDTNGLLCNVFRVIRKRENIEAFQRLGAVSPHSREIWHEYKRLCLEWIKEDKTSFHAAKKKACFDDYDDDVIAAFCFWYCQRNGFGGSFLSAYGTQKDRIRKLEEKPRIYTYRSQLDELGTYQKRFEYVQIENKDFAEVFRIYDNAAALFYCDPPYDVACSSDYKTGWNVERTKELVDLAARAEGGVILSCYDSPIYEELLKAGFRRERCKAYMSCCKTKYEERVETLYWRFKEKTLF